MNTKNFLIMILFDIGLFALLYPISTDIYIPKTPLVFNAISVIVFGLFLYYSLSAQIKGENINKLMLYVFVSALPHVIYTVMSFGSWVCLGISVILLIILYRKKKIEQ